MMKLLYYFDSKLKWEVVINYTVRQNFCSMMLYTFFSIALNMLMSLLEQAVDTQPHAKMKSTCESHIIKPVTWCSLPNKQKSPKALRDSQFKLSATSAPWSTSSATGSGAPLHPGVQPVLIPAPGQDLGLHQTRSSLSLASSLLHEVEGVTHKGSRIQLIHVASLSQPMRIGSPACPCLMVALRARHTTSMSQLAGRHLVSQRSSSCTTTVLDRKI